MSIGYGFFPGGDPRNFTPDEECCSPEEILSWETACAEWNKGNEVQVGASCVVASGMLITIAPFGIGTYQFDDDEGEPER